MAYQYPSKSYLHFDKITSFNKKVENYVCDFEKNPRHSFLPLIYTSLTFDKYKKIEQDSTNNKKRNDKIIPVREKNRPIMYASHIDNFIYKHYGIQLNILYNTCAKNYKINDSAIAYRNNKKGKNNIFFAAEVINFIMENRDCYIYVGDYSSFFDTLNHEYLKKRIAFLYDGEKIPEHQYKIFKSLTKFSYIHKADIQHKLGSDLEMRKKGYQSYFSSPKDFRKFKKENSIVESNNKNKKIIRTNLSGKGIPQGTAMSAVYSNIYMIEIDKYISQLATKFKGLYRRYSDDFIVILPKISDKEFFSIKKTIRNKISSGKLSLNEKTQTLKFHKNKLVDTENNKETRLDYLGFVFDGATVKIREKSIYKYYRSAYKLIEKGKIVSVKKGHVGKRTRLTYKRKIYQKYHHLGERTGIKYNYKKRKYGTFISYVNNSQKIFDQVSPRTKNLMNKQLSNHQKKINKKIRQAVQYLESKK